MCAGEREKMPPVSATLCVALLLLWPLALPSGPVWILLYWSALLWGYESPSERWATLGVWLLAGLAPWVAAVEQQRVAVALSPPMRALANLPEGRPYGRLFPDPPVPRGALGGLEFALGDFPGFWRGDDGEQARGGLRRRQVHGNDASLRDRRADDVAVGLVRDHVMAVHRVRRGAGGSVRPGRSVAIPIATSAPASCASRKPATSSGRMPANVCVSDRAMVTAGLANDVLAVNQYAAKM